MKIIDNSGRIIIPGEIRKKLDIRAGDAFNIYTKGSSIVLEQLNRRCFSCGGYDNLVQCGDITLCIDCARGISESIKVMYDEYN